MIRGQVAVSNRGERHPQVECFCDRPRVCERFAPPIIECTNANPETMNRPFWNCLPKNWSKRHHVLESEILCEGWDNETDDYMVEGSCRIKVRMTYDWVQDQVDVSLFPFLFVVGIVVLMAWILLTVIVWVGTYGQSRPEMPEEIEEKCGIPRIEEKEKVE
jgi:hypothetical protein